MHGGESTVNQRTAHAFAGLCAAGLAVVVAAGCSSKSTPPGQADRPPGGDSSATAVPGDTPTAGAIPPDSTPTTGTTGGTTTTRACTASDLTLAQMPGGDAAGGTVVVAIGLTNKSGHACSVNGYPDFTLTGSTGNQPVTIEHSGLGIPALNAPPVPVTLNPAAKAGFAVQYLNRPTSGDGSCGAATQMSLAIGGTRLTGPVQIAVCGSPLKVSPYVAGSKLTIT
jgi:hypothetical protein